MVLLFFVIMGVSCSSWIGSASRAAPPWRRVDEGIFSMAEFGSEQFVDVNVQCLRKEAPSCDREVL